MRRVILAVTGTVAGLVALLSFKSHTSAVTGLTGSPAAVSGSAVSGSAAPGSGGAASAASGSTVSGSAVSGGAPAGAVSANLPAGEHAVNGSPAETIYGPVQVQVVVRGTRIVNVGILERPESTDMDIQIGQYAFPKLVSETLSRQSARIDAVSGATYTSGGYVKSLQSAIDKGA